MTTRQSIIGLENKRPPQEFDHKEIANKIAELEQRINTQEEETCRPEDESQRHRQQIQLKYLESENTNLMLENDDLNNTLKINKDIIQNLLKGDKSYNAQVEYAMAQITQENELWESRVKTLTE